MLVFKPNGTPCMLKGAKKVISDVETIDTFTLLSVGVGFSMPLPNSKGHILTGDIYHINKRITSYTYKDVVFDMIPVKVTGTRRVVKVCSIPPLTQLTLFK